jgi:hypothetical protein
VKVDYQGNQRYVCGRARYAEQPEPGTIVGPNDTKEHLVVIGQDEDLTLFAYATVPDLQAARERVIAGELPRSLAESKIR